MAYEIPTIQGIDLAGIDRAVTQNKLYQMQMEAAKRENEQKVQKANALKAMMDSLPPDQRLLATIAPEKWAERQADPWYGTKAVGNSLYAIRDGKPVRVAGGITLEGMDAPMAPMSGASAPTGGSPAPSATPPVPSAKVPEVFREAINANAERTGLDPELFGRVIGAESGFRPGVVSNKGAQGLAQVMPGTGRDPGYGVQPMKDSTPDENLRFGADYLKAMSDRYSGNVPVALAAYNWGPGNVDKWLEAGADPRKLPAETQAYIAKITGRPFSGLTQTAQAGGTATDAGGGGAGARPRLFIDENGKPISAGDGLVWAQGPQGRVAVPAPGTEVRPLPPQEVQALGLPVGTVVMRKPNGELNILSKPDEQMVEVYDPNSPTGTTMVPRSQAAGRPGAPSQGLSLTTNPDGSVSLTQGRQKPGEKPMTEGAARAGGFANRMVEAEKRVEALPKDFNPAGFWNGVASRVPGGNYALSKDFQLYRQAAEDWIRAKLRKESGAVIGADEMDAEFRQYFPQPGDSKEVIAQKKKSRETAIQSIVGESQGGYGKISGSQTPSADASPSAPSSPSASVPPLPPGFEIIGGQ
jgi:soluble lytic murein transglycosylase-like protein